jgi:choline dehydrogenase-like flavoprotein
MPRTFDLNDRSLVLIVGSGAGGGTLGNELAQKGIRTLILEAGPRIEREQHIDDERKSFAQLTWLDKRTTSGSWEVAKASPNFPAWTCKVVGGTTVHWAGCSIRFQEHEFRSKDVYGDIPGASLLNWPLTLAELEPYYDKAEDKMGVTGTHGIPLLDANNNQIVMAAGAKKVGYKEYSTGNMAINSRPRDGRPATIQDGFCFQGIRSNAKWSTLNTEIPKGEATGNLEVRPQCHVLKIECDKSGKVTGVVYADKQGNHYQQRGRIVCVAGNSIETPRILLNSASSLYPEGLANFSGQVGKNYMRHMNGSLWAVFDKPVHMYRGNTMAGCVKDERYHKPDREFVGGYYMETLHLGLPFLAGSIATNADFGGWGCEFTQTMEAYEHIAGMWLVGEDMPQETNCVTLHPSEKDRFGMPIPNVHLDEHVNDMAMRNHAYKRGAIVYDAVGATRIIRTPPGASTHNLGSCRQSAHREDGVCNKWGQAHDVKNLFISDGSQFTTSTAENPTLTIVALAIRQADYIADQMARQNI